MENCGKHAFGFVITTHMRICMIHITMCIVCRFSYFRHYNLVVMLECANKNVFGVNRTMMAARSKDNDGYLTMQIQVIRIMQKQINILKCRSLSLCLSLSLLSLSLSLSLSLTSLFTVSLSRSWYVHAWKFN